MIKVSELYIYPVKSLAGIKVNSIQLSPLGFQHDRRWMIIDNDGKFMSQRESAKMATIETAFKDNQLVLSHNASQITVPKSNNQNKISVTIWKDTIRASHVCKTLDNWLSDILQTPCRLVYMEDHDQRQIDKDFAPLENHVSFADGYPILLISQASIDDLNSKLPEPININRFRPNLVVSGTNAFAEDQWQDLSINAIEFKGVKTCSRCIIPSINQESGKQDQLKMIATLNKYRKVDNKIKFGQNLIYKKVDLIDNQIISCGDEVKLINSEKSE